MREVFDIGIGKEESRFGYNEALSLQH